MRPLVDDIIIVGSTYSNYKEYFPIPDDFKNDELFVREPHFHVPMHSETDKRNFGLDIARNQGYTHFLMCDADEFYKPDEFNSVKHLFHVKQDLQGVVCPSVVYFGKPTLTIGRDITLVPFIHKITPTVKHEFNRRYPFAWEGKQIRIDPTRSLNINSGVEYTEEVTMHHYSHCRVDYARKIRNSTARANLERSGISEEIVRAKEGYFCNFYNKPLRTAPDYFGLNELLDKNIFPVAATDQESESR
jgi:glycosyltransferase involved in cell wall biosynthesis